MNSAEIDISMKYKIRQSHSGSLPLKHFDDATMKGYQVPHKDFEIDYCATDPAPVFCDRYNLSRIAKLDIPLSTNFVVKISSVGEGSGRGLFATRDIPKGSVLGIQETIHPVYVAPSTTELIYYYHDMIDETEIFYNYMDGYGFNYVSKGSDAYMVESNVLTFVNHGCNGDYNIDSYTGIEKKKNKAFFTEQNVTHSHFPKKRRPFFSPFLDRHVHLYDVDLNEVTRDIKAGDEILSDYLFYTDSYENSFFSESQVLKRICNGEEVGLITKAESDN